MSLSSPVPPAARRGRGRPRRFDLDTALDKAIMIFAERGYHATSIPELSAAMELAQGSVYKAFKDKQAVFAAALARYRSKRSAALEQRLAGAVTGRERLRTALSFYAESASGHDGRRGCLITSSAVEIAVHDDQIAAAVTMAFDQIESRLDQLIAEGQADRSLNPELDRAACARLLLCLIQGMRVIGKTGRPPAAMEAVVAQAMRLLDWPRNAN